MKNTKSVASLPHAEGPRLISKPEVLDRVGVTFPTLWLWMRNGIFPRSRDLGGKTCWLASEIDAWILSRPVRRYKGDEEAA
jgi:predicted DNA-binding transcriptional regulator AlpA